MISIEFNRKANFGYTDLKANVKANFGYTDLLILKCVGI